MSQHTIDTKKIQLGDHVVDYHVRIRARAKYLRMTVGVKEGLVVTIPTRRHERFIENFLHEKSTWIIKQLGRVKHDENRPVLPHDDYEYKAKKKEFFDHIKKRVDFFDSLYGFGYNRITIRNQTSLWGSCTRSGNLQFNFKLNYLSQEFQDYVVVHELCHVKEHNHGKQFWLLVAKTFPHYRVIRKILNQYRLKEV